MSFLTATVGSPREPGSPTRRSVEAGLRVIIATVPEGVLVVDVQEIKYRVLAAEQGTGTPELV